MNDKKNLENNACIKAAAGNSYGDLTQYFDKLKAFRTANDGAMSHLGIQITKIEPGFARSEMPYKKELHANSIGGVHGGIIFTLADSVGGTAAATRGNLVTTSNGSMHFLHAAIQPEKLIGEAVELKSGKNLLVYDVKITTETGRLIAQATMEYFRLEKKIKDL